MWEIKGKDNQTKAIIPSLEYNGNWMGESYVSLTVESPTPVAFAIGDYLMYRGERFEINYDPGKIKSASRFAKGDAFKYENIKLNSFADELTRCDFLDVVPSDNQIHFTGLPKFSFYGGVQDLAKRIQANLDRTYPGMWTVVVSSEYSDMKELNVSVDTQKVWDALSILVNDFKTYFTIKGRTITIGAAGIPAAHLFKYGKGNGLYGLEQNAETDQAIVTRLRAYGSTRNLPHRYYNNIPAIDRANAPVHSIVSRQYVNSGSVACVLKFRLLSQYVDLSKCVTDGTKHWFSASINNVGYAAYWDDKESCYTIGERPSKHVDGVSNTLLRKEQMEEIVTGTLVSFAAYKDGAPGIVTTVGIPDNMAVQYLMLPSFPYTTQDPYIDSPNIDKIGIREGTVFFDGSQEDLEEIYPSIEGMTAEQLKAAGVPCNSTGALDVLVSAEQMTDNGVGDINEGETQTTPNPPTFKITLKDLGFNIKDHIIPGNSEAPAISFKTGMLGGRDFEIVGGEPIKNASGAVTGYEIELNRVYDDGIKLWFPYKDYNAKAGDKFVLLHIEMPEVYIKAAAQRLLEVATAWLAKNDYSRSVYAPKVDEIFMARQHDEAMASGGKIASLHDTLKEGMMLLFEDEDFNINASIFIDRLTIKETENSAPTYEVVLKEEKTVGRLDKMQNQIDSLASGGQGSGGYNASQIRSLIDAYGGTRFLSKIKSDRTPYSLAIGGRATAEAGMQFGLTYIPGLVGGMGGWIGPDGAGELRSLILWSSLEVPELRFNRVEIVQGVDWHAPGGGIVESCEGDTVTLKLEEGDYGAVAEDDLCLGIWHFARPADKARCNLLKDTATPQTAASSGPTDNFRFVRYKFDVPVDFKAGDSFVLSLDNVERLAGTATEFHARLYDMDASQSVRMISSLVKFNAANRTCVLTVVNPSSSGTVELLLYAGLNGETAGNSVRFTRPMLVRGETPAEWNYAESEFDGLNAEADSNDSETGKGLFRFAGFATMYFRIKAVSGDNNGTATIQMREGYEHLRPQPGMHFVAFGNRTRKDRQTCRYATRTYERLMKDVDDWTFRPDNIKLQFGDLSNLTIDGLTMSGYSAYLNNVYFDGVLRQLENSPLRLTYETYGDKYVGDNDDCMIRLTALKGVEDVTDSVTWAVSASTGAATPSVTPEGTLTLGKSVLAGGEEATVTVTATWRKTPDAAPKTASAIIIIRDNALLKGETGSSYTPNLLKGTKTWDKDAGWGYGTGMGRGSEPDGEMNGFTVLHGNFEGHGTQAYIELAQQFFPVVKGQTYTLSFWAKGTGNMRTFCYPAVNGFLLPGGTGDRSNITLSDTEQVYQLTADWKRHRVSFRVDGTPASENTRILFRVPAGNEAWIAGAKLEIGANNNPEWSPNDEDLKGDPGKDGEDAVTYDWETDPGVIRCESDGTPIDTSVTVRCYRVKGEARSSLASGGIVMSLYRVQWRIQTDEGISGWTDYTDPVVLDSRDTHPKIMLRVIPQTIAGSEPEVLSEHTVGYVCDGTTGPQGSVVRIRGLFEAGEYYYDGETPVTTSTGSKIRWLDVVWVEDISGNRYYKRCIKSGTYTASNGPHSTDNETSTGWADFSQLDNLIVQLLIAKNAHIQFLNGQEIVFGETVNRADKLWGRIGVPTEGGGYIMWAGGADTSLATYILDKEGRARFGKINDNHIVIDPLEKQITVRNGSCRKMITINGADHTLENIYGVEDNINAGNLNHSYATANPTYTTTVSAGTVKLAKAGGKLKVSLTAILETWSVGYTGKDSAGVSMPGQYVKGTATVTLGIYNGSVPVKEVSATVKSPILTENLKGYRTEDLTVEATNLSVGTYTVRTKVELVQQRDTDINGRIVQATAMATVTGAAKVFGSPELYEAFLCGNGFISANSMRDYFRSVKTTSGYMTEASAGDYGVRVSDDGLAAKDSNGAWNAGIMTYEKEAVDANKCVLPQLGIRMYTTNANTANLPTGAGTRYGSITTTTLNATDGHHIQEWKSFSQPVQCYTRRCMNNVWGAWTKNY